MKFTVATLMLSAFLLSADAFIVPPRSSTSMASHINRSNNYSGRTTPQPFVRTVHVLASQTQREQSTSKSAGNDNGQPESQGVSLKKYKIRSTILQHALQTKQKEASTLRDKLTILQDVIQKLQASNKSLLSKVQELKNERNNVFKQVEEAQAAKNKELWPPEMEVKLMKEEFHTKELEWENALNVAQGKYNDLKDRVNRLMLDVEERDADIRFYQERSMVDESEINYLQGLVEKFQGRLEDAVQDSKGSDKVVQDDQLSEMRSLIADLEEQNVIARDQFQELNTQWKERREEMQRIISSTQNQVLSLETDLEQSRLEKDQIQTMLDETKVELEESKEIIQSLRQDAVSPPSGEEEDRAKQFGKESLNIAAAAVRQAEGREMELKKKVARIEKKMEDTKGENDLLVQKVLELELQLDTYEKASAAEDVIKREEELLKRIDALEQELESAMASFEAMASGKGISPESLKINGESNAEWESKIAAQKQEYEELIGELKAEIDRLMKAKTAASLTIPPEEDKPRQKRLRRLVNRVKSLWRREKKEVPKENASSEDETVLEPTTAATSKKSNSRTNEQ